MFIDLSASHIALAAVLQQIVLNTVSFLVWA